MEIRPWSHGDLALAVAAQPYLSMETLTRRFMAGTGGRLPEWYLRHLAAGPRPTWDAEVAAESGMLLGWAEFGRLPGEPTGADLALVVAVPSHARGLAARHAAFC